MNKLKIAFIGLLAVTVAFVSVTAYCHVKASQEYPPNWAIRAKVVEDPEDPSEYWNLTDLDPWTLEAIENTGEWVYTYSWKCKVRFDRNKICYKGEYYEFDIVWGDSVPETIVKQRETYQKVVDYSPIGFVTLGTLWAVFGLVWFKYFRTF